MVLMDALLFVVFVPVPVICGMPNRGALLSCAYNGTIMVRRGSARGPYTLEGYTAVVPVPGFVARLGGSPWAMGE